jgi:hypothetical protein
MIELIGANPNACISGLCITLIFCSLDRSCRDFLGAWPALFDADAQGLDLALQRLVRALSDGTAHTQPGCRSLGRSIESTYGHIRTPQNDAPALMLRGSVEFVELAAYRRFIDEIVSLKNARNGKRIDADRALLQPLPQARIW